MGKVESKTDASVGSATHENTRLRRFSLMEREKSGSKGG